MSDEPERYKIPLFDGNNFDNWKFRMETLLNEMDLMPYIEEDYNEMVIIEETDADEERQQKEREAKTHSKNDRKCKSQIIQRIADSHLEYAKDKDSAFDLWLGLCNTFERRGIASQLLIRKTLLSMKFDAKSDSLSSHFLKFDKLVRDLRSNGATLQEVKDVKSNSSGELPSSTAFASQSGQHVKRGQASESPFRFPYNCNYCGKPGHKIAFCRKRVFDAKNDAQKIANTASNLGDNGNANAFCFCATTKGSGDATRWILDSGATEHLVSSHVKLENTFKLENPIKIRVAKTGEFLLAETVGEIQFSSLVDGKDVPVKIRNVLSVPQLQYNLLSVCRPETSGFIVIFEKGRGLIKKENLIVAIALRNNAGLYELNFKREAFANMVSNEDQKYDLWHKRMGHLNPDDMKRIQDQISGIKIDFPNLSNLPCEVCIEGKQAAKPHNQPRRRATRPLQLIHSDLTGPISPISYDSKKYVLCFIDDFTHFTASYVLESKTEVLKFFKIYEAMATTHFNTKISRFRCDNGGEYISRETKEFFESKGIQFEFTIRYTPQQNGVAERMNRTLLEKARCMLLNSKLNKTFWTEAVLAAVYLTNRSPTSALDGKVPSTLWFGEEPKIAKLRVFGCIAFLKRPKQLVQGKLDSRTIKCYFVGYCPNGYKLWSIEDQNNTLCNEGEICLFLR